MSLEKDILAARRAVDKLNTYSEGHKAARGFNSTKMYRKLNSEANAAILKLPKMLRSRFMLDILS